MNENITNFYEILEKNPKILKQLQNKKKKYSNDAEGNCKFINEVIVPLAQDKGYDLKLEDFIENEINASKTGELDPEDLEDVTGGIGKKTLATLGITLLSGSLFSGIAIKNNLISFPSLSASTGINSTKKTAKKSQEQSEESYKAMIEQEVKDKEKAKRDGTYETNYGYGSYEHQRGLLEIPPNAEMISVGDDKKSLVHLGEGYRTEYHKYHKNAPLFRHAPTYLDVLQGGMGNCYFESAMIAVMLSGAGDPSEFMRDLGDGHVVVRFLVTDKNTNQQKPIYIKVRKSIEKIQKGNSVSKIVNMRSHVLWVSLAFKAYRGGAQKGLFENSPLELQTGQMGSLESVFKHSFGLKNSEYIEIPENIAMENTQSGYSKEARAIFDKLSTATQEGSPVCTGSKAKEALTNKNLHSEHAFVVVRTEEAQEKRYVVLLDPQESSKTIRMELPDYLMNFASINIGK
ncbi:MAG: hypothetical protein LBH37_04030 [Oscillospiraceae bacterium]|jgi:hypothetical protein|nr:hypothetical protein [Oscillospiraceae bacterium]